MPKANKTSSHKIDNNPSQDEPSTHEDSSSEHENDPEVNFNPSHVQHVIPSKFLPYIPRWTGMSLMIFVIDF